MVSWFLALRHGIMAPRKAGLQSIHGINEVYLLVYLGGHPALPGVLRTVRCVLQRKQVQKNGHLRRHGPKNHLAVVKKQ